MNMTTLISSDYSMIPTSEVPFSSEITQEHSAENSIKEAIESPSEFHPTGSNPTTKKSGRKAYTPEDLHTAIERVLKGETQAHVARTSPVPPRTISHHVHKKLRELEEQNALDTVILPKEKFPKTIEPKLVEWIVEKLNQNQPVSRAEVYIKARELLNNINSCFSLTPSWFRRFRERHEKEFGGVKFKRKSKKEKEFFSLNPISSPEKKKGKPFEELHEEEDEEETEEEDLKQETMKNSYEIERNELNSNSKMLPFKSKSKMKTNSIAKVNSYSNSNRKIKSKKKILENHSASPKTEANRSKTNLKTSTFEYSQENSDLFDLDPMKQHECQMNLIEWMYEEEGRITKQSFQQKVSQVLTEDLGISKKPSSSKGCTSKHSQFYTIEWYHYLQLLLPDFFHKSTTKERMKMSSIVSMKPLEDNEKDIDKRNLKKFQDMEKAFEYLFNRKTPNDMVKDEENIRKQLEEHGQLCEHENEHQPEKSKINEIIPKECEKELLEWILYMHASGLPLTQEEIVLTGQKILSQANYSIEFNLNLLQFFCNNNQEILRQVNCSFDLKEEDRETSVNVEGMFQQFQKERKRKFPNQDGVVEGTKKHRILKKDKKMNDASATIKEKADTESKSNILSSFAYV